MQGPAALQIAQDADRGVCAEKGTMMSRYMHYGVSTDPLQRPRAAARANAAPLPSSHALQNGLRAIAPRLALVFFAAAIVQMLVHWLGN
jgi:hypothetical protein